MIKVNNLSKHYKNLKAVDQVSFEVQEGRCLGLLGPNGAGKTTTIEIMEGIIKPTSGSVEYLVETNMNVSELIGIQFQNTALQDFLTVRETLQLFASFYEHSLAINTLIELCDLGSFIDRDNRLLSGGQRQRLLLALALINDPKIIFLDEPTTGLDPQSRRNFWQLIGNIKRQGKTIILTTHYMDEAEQLCDDIVVMDNGKVIETGTPKSLLNKHFNEVFIYLPIERVTAQIAATNKWQKIDVHYEIRTKNVESTIMNLMQMNVSLEDLHIKSANLDDLFLKLTGHSLQG